MSLQEDFEKETGNIYPTVSKLIEENGAVNKLELMELREQWYLKYNLWLELKVPQAFVKGSEMMRDVYINQHKGGNSLPEFSEMKDGNI
jgi:hypothetical protein